MAEMPNFNLPSMRSAFYNKNQDHYLIDTGEGGLVVARRVPSHLTEMRVPNLLITSIGNAYSALEDLSCIDEMPEFDPRVVMGELVDSLAYGRCNRTSLHEEKLDQVVKDIIYDATPVGLPDPRMALHLSASLKVITAELHALLREVGAYANNTLLYEYVKQADPWHALLRKRPYAVYK